MKYLFLFLIILGGLTAHAQPKAEARKYPKAISVSPLALLQLDNTVMAGFEYRLRPKTVVVLEGGYIFYSTQMDVVGDRGYTRGFIIRPSAKFFINQRNSTYFQPQLFYKQASKRMYDWLGRDCVNNVPAYESLQDFTYRRKVYGLNAIFGVIVPTRKGKLIFDFYAGLGGRVQDSKVPDVPNSCYDQTNRSMLFFEEGHLLPSFPGGARLLFPIK